MATLKISDLSVGDWVMVNERPRKISVLANVWNGLNEVLVGYVTHVYPGGYNGVFYKPIEKIKPIPITAEILEKNGFESTTKPNVFILTHGKLQLYVSNEFDGWTMSFVNFMKRLCILQVIRKSYIHDLQHALRLAGVDKEINL